ncbi:MAG: diguanylate cyclase [Phycisphaerae bacterium]
MQRTSDSRWPDIVAAALSLQCKSTVLVVAVVLFVTAAVSAYLLRSSVEVVHAMHKEQVVHLASMLAEAVAEPLATRDVETLRRRLRDAADGAPIQYVLVTDTTGSELAAAEYARRGMLKRVRAGAHGRPSASARPILYPATSQTGAFLDVAYPVRRNPGGGRTRPDVELLGYVRTGIAVGRWERSMIYAMDLVTGVGVVLVVLAIPLGFYLVRRVLAPIEELSDAMNEFSRGKLHVRSHVRRNDEIGRLATAFNRMADQHQQTHDRIVKLNTDLEVRVAQRTKQLREIASREPLTGLYNRRYFNEVFTRGVSEGQRYGTDLACIMLDLDDFKRVNDVFGHQGGDEVLILVAKTISRELRGADVAARFGGDEFVAMLPRTDTARALVLAGRIVDAFADAVQERFPTAAVSMSIGIASLKTAGVTNAEALLRSADQALYQAKSAGTHRIVVAGTGAEPAESPAGAASAGG